MDNSWYWVPFFTLFVFALIGLIISIGVYLVDKSAPWPRSNYIAQEENRINARRTLVFILALPACFLWPVLIPLALAYLTYKLIQDARS